ncbi:hypothetical protein [Miltoncostaea oceani]|uniref:hypothetical protein n=1 Tax=Miltoncostaea oceani TaxID=2843216 RepID=UPI001C3E698C|nr:hypothetical protein [Miltoncostaea oceani]
MADSVGVLDELAQRGRARRTAPPRRAVPGSPRIGENAAPAPPAASQVADAPVSTAPAPAPASEQAPAIAEPSIPRRARESVLREPERMVNVHARLGLSQHERLDRFIALIEREGWGTTSKIELIQMLVHELPEVPDESFGERLRVFRQAQARGY